MKKKPSLILSALLNILNNLDTDEEYSINEISEKSGLHWQTANEYLRILIYLLKFSPKIKINDNNKVQIINQSEFFDNLSIGQKILITLYESKSFDEKSSIRISNIFDDHNLELYLEELRAKLQIMKLSEDDRFFITKQGKLVVISLYSDLTKQIYNFDDTTNYSNQIDKNLEAIEKLNLKYNTIVKQNNEILLQNQIIMFFLVKQGYNLQDLSSGETSSEFLNYIQKTFQSKTSIHSDQELNINIKMSDKFSSNYESSEFKEVIRKYEDNIKNKKNRKQVEVIR